MARFRRPARPLGRRTAFRGGSFGAVLLALGACASGPELTLRGAGSRVLVTVGQDLFAEYRADGPRGPAVWPVLAPGGEPMTRGFPFFAVDGESQDQPHHTSLWFALADLGGVDFWSGPGRIVPAGPPLLDQVGKGLVQPCEWRAADGAVLAREQRTLRFSAGTDWRAIDLSVALRRDDGELLLGAGAAGAALRLRPVLALEGPGAQGRAFDSQGRTGLRAGSGPARWVAHSAVVGGELHTVALFDHPANHAEAVRWVVRGAGLVVAAPFAAPEAAGSGGAVVEPVRVPAGAELRLRYRVFVQRGDVGADGVARAFAAFAATAR